MKHKKSRGSKRVRLSNEYDELEISMESETDEFERGIKPENRTNNFSPTQKEVSWPKGDILKLIERIEDNIPEDDNLSFHTRLHKLNWEDITFKNYTVEECQKVWENIHKKIRKFRLFKEVLDDVKGNVNEIKRKSRALPKHPEMPKYPRSGYMHYFLEKKRKIMRKHPGTPYSMIRNRIGEMYRNLEPEDRKKYEKLASEAFEEYSKKLNEFYKKYPELKPGQAKTIPQDTELQEDESDNELKRLQKKPKTPFELFFKNQLENEEHNVTNEKSFRIKCRDEWTCMLAEEKANWIKIAEQEHSNYLKEVATYSKLYPNIKLKPVKSVINKQEKLIMQQLAGRPAEPPLTGFHLFMHELGRRGEVQNIQFKDMTTHVAEKWGKCTEDERNDYKKRCKHLWKEYQKDLDAYLETLAPDERNQILNERRKRKSRKLTVNKPRPKFIPFVSGIEPKKPPDTAYEYFLSIYGDSRGPGMWTKFTKKEKEVYEKKLEKAKRKYICEYELYLNELKKTENREFMKITNSYLESESEAEED